MSSVNDKSAEMSESPYTGLVNGESQHLKRMWKVGTTRASHAKMLISVNILPEWNKGTI